MTEAESLLAKQIRNMSGIRSDQPVQPLSLEEQIPLNVPSGGKLIYSGLIEQTGTGVPIVYGPSEFNPLGLTKAHERTSTGYFKMKFAGDKLQGFSHDLRTVSAFAQSSHLTYGVMLCVSPYWSSSSGIWTLELWVTNFRWTAGSPGSMALADELRFCLEIKLQA